MQKFNKILLYAQGEGWAKAPLAKALMLAGAHHSHLTVLDVVEDLPADLRMLVKAAIHISDLQAAALKDRRMQIEKSLRALNDKSRLPVVKVLPGKPSVEIVREVLRSKTDLLLLAAGRKRRPGHALLGSTEMHLIRKCPCPVWVVKPTRRKKYRTIMAAIDIDPDDPGNAALNGRILGAAASLAEMEGSELHVIHAWKLFGENTLSYRVGLSHDQVARLGGRLRAERLDSVTGLIQKHAPGIPPDRIHIMKGDAARLILEAAKREKVELIIMGTVGRTGLAGFFIGNTAETMLQQVDCSVLALKPEGFVTPVRL